MSGARFLTKFAFAALVIVATAIGGFSLDQAKAETGKSVAGFAGDLHVDDGGEGGVPVVFIHSFAGDISHWAAQLEHLRKTRRAVAIDARGHGKSDAPKDGDYLVDSQANDIAAVADALKLERFVLVGHSMGGSSAIAYASAHPDRVAGLVLAGAAGKLPDEEAKKIVGALQANFTKVYDEYWNKLLTGARPAVRDRLNQGKKTIPDDAALTIIKAIFAYDPVAAPKTYPGPKLAIVTPSADTPTDLHHLVEGLPHLLIKGTSHWMQMDKPDEFNRILDEFLSQKIEK